MSAMHISAQESKVNMVNTIINLEITTADLIINKVGEVGFQNLNEELKSNSENSSQILNNYLGNEISTIVQHNLIQIASEANKLKEICPNEDGLRIIFTQENFPAANGQCLFDCGVSATLGYTGCASFVHPAAISACALAVLYLHYRCNQGCDNLILGAGSSSGGDPGGTGGGKSNPGGNNGETPGGPPGGGWKNRSLQSH